MSLVSCRRRNQLCQLFGNRFRCFDSMGVKFLISPLTYSVAVNAVLPLPRSLWCQDHRSFGPSHQGMHCAVHSPICLSIGILSFRRRDRWINESRLWTKSRRRGFSVHEEMNERVNVCDLLIRLYAGEISRYSARRELAQLAVQLLTQ